MMYELSLRNIAIRLRYVFTHTIRQIAMLMNVSKSTIHRWLHQTSNFEQQPVTKPKVQTSNIDLESIVRESSFLSLKDIIEKYKLGISNSTLSRRLKRSGYSKKKVHTIGLPDMTKIRDARKRFSQKYFDLSLDDVLSVDETSFYSQLEPYTGWSKSGVRITAPMQRKVSKRFTLTAAISSNGVISNKIVSNSSNEKHFLDFLSSLRNYPQKYIMLDNVAFHKTKKVLKLLEDMGKIPIFVAPYSPEWNPVECYFWMIKSRFRKQTHDIKNARNLRLREYN